MLKRFHEWIEWRRLIRKRPTLARCFLTIKQSGQYQRGYLSFQASLVQPSEAWRFGVSSERWYPEVLKALSIGVFDLEYLAPLKSRMTKTYFVAVPDYKILGVKYSSRYIL